MNSATFVSDNLIENSKKYDSWKYHKYEHNMLASSRTHYFDEMVNDPFNVNNEGCHFQLFSERVIE